MKNISIIITSVFLSLLVVTIIIVIIRGCFTGIIPASICGFDLARPPSEFRKMTQQDVFITSDISESQEFSVALGRTTASLIDGLLDTMAQPGGLKINYLISFVDNSQIKQITIHWKDYGINTNYISQWKLEALSDEAQWKEIAGGNSPQGDQTVINKKFNATQLRLTAQSTEDWIGVYEIEIIARPL